MPRLEEVADLDIGINDGAGPYMAHLPQLGRLTIGPVFQPDHAAGLNLTLFSPINK
jgi:hypothetical protein